MDYTIPPIFQDKAVRDSLPPSEVELHVECFRDLGVLCKTWWPSFFRTKYTLQQRQYIDFINGILADQMKALQQGKFAARRAVVIGSRGTSKTGIILKGLGMRGSLYGPWRNMVAIGKTFKHIRRHTNQLRQHLMDSPDIRQYFPNISSSFVPDKEVDPSQSAEVWTTFTKFNPEGFTCSALGVGMPIRGLGEGDRRVELCIADDFDNHQWLRNDELREYYHNEWWEGDVLYSVSQLECENIPSLIILTDSCKGDNALAEKLFRQEGWEKLRVSVCDENLKVLDPSHISQERFDIEIERHRANGTIDVFAREMMSKPYSPEGKPFKPSMFKDIFYDPSNPGFRTGNCITFMMADLARTVNPTSSESAYVIATVDFSDCVIWVQKAEGFRLNPDEFYRQMAEDCIAYGVDHLGVEFAGLHLHAQNQLRDILIQYGLYHLGEVIDLRPQAGKLEQSGYKRGKTARIILSLRGWFEMGIVKLHPSCTRLIDQLLSVTDDTTAKDIADAFAYLRQMMEVLNYYFSPTKKIEYHKTGRERDIILTGSLEEIMDLQTKSGKWPFVEVIETSILEEPEYAT